MRFHEWTVLIDFFIYFSCTDQIGARSFRSVFANERIQADFEAPTLNGQVNCRAAVELAELNVERTTVKWICERMKKLKANKQIVRCLQFFHSGE